MASYNSPGSSKEMTVGERLNILNKLEAGATVRDLAIEYNVSERSIRRHRQSAQSIRKFAEDSHGIHRKRIRTRTFNDLDKEVYNWFLECRLLGHQITDSVLLEKAKELHEEIGGRYGFAGSRGWLWRFKKTYGEAADADKAAVDTFKQKLTQLLKENEITDDNLYNMDETGLCWRMLPGKTLAGVEGGKMKKEKITLALCANASGSHKLPLLFVHKYESPRSLKHCKDSLPVSCVYQKNAWVDNEIFQSWYQDDFKRYVKERQIKENRSGKVLLLIDNFKSHILPKEETVDEHFKVLFLPPNTSSLIQPMDRGVIAKCKERFRHKLLQRALQHTEGISEFYADYDLKDCINLIHETWIQVTADDIFNAWSKILNRSVRQSIKECPKEDESTSDERQSFQTIYDEEIRDWFNECNVEEKIGEKDTIAECFESEPVSLIGEETDRLLYYLQKIMTTEPQIQEHAKAIIDYYNEK
ncbi:jerky protein homolog-like [Colletes gigas]|uniref:jerky protein homolog-like n=1 Tax=Colletes gigas TaxID=935657 RepID=UPI001C9BB5A3|nr:jerky protein homolog-like [Colletes gigas]